MTRWFDLCPPPSCHSYNSPSLALLTGDMLRECLANATIVKTILYGPILKELIEKHVHVSNFEVSSDALKTLRELFTHEAHKAVITQFLVKEYDTVRSTTTTISPLCQGMLRAPNNADTCSGHASV